MLFSADTIGGPLHPFSGITCPVIVLRPESRGTRAHQVRRSARQPPAIRPRYLSAAKDRDTMVAGIRALRRIMAAPPMAPFIEAEHEPGPACASDDDLLDFVRRRGSTVYHPTSTCRMGSDPTAVVDARLKRARHRAAARRRCLDHAGARLRQHQRADDHDRREGRRHDPGGRAGTLGGTLRNRRASTPINRIWSRAMVWSRFVRLPIRQLFGHMARGGFQFSWTEIATLLRVMLILPAVFQCAAVAQANDARTEQAC